MESRIDMHKTELAKKKELVELLNQEQLNQLKTKNVLNNVDRFRLIR